jgi:nitrate reductase gamma subunit
MRDFLLFGLAPYFAAALLIGVPVWRSRSRAHRASLAEVCRESARLYHGTVLWRWGLGLLALGHAAALVAPRLVLLWDLSPVRLVLLEALGLAVGFAAFAGLARLIHAPDGSSGEATIAGVLGRKPADTLLLALLVAAMGSGLAVSVLHRWGSAWYSLSILPWFRSLLALRPDVSLVAPLPFVVRLHVLAGIASMAVLPFSRALYALAWPAVRLARWLAATRKSAPFRVALAGSELLLVALFGLFLMGALRRVGVSQGYAPQQPIAFSHQLHAGNNRIPCLYCHFAAETSRHAGIPPAGICMNCHSQLKLASAEVEKLKESVAQRRPLRWTRIHALPDFVYFSHSQHVRGGGLACQRCHGPVETMERVGQFAPLTMGWCLDCHRQEQVLPASQRRDGKGTVHVAMGGLDCGKCHY